MTDTAKQAEAAHLFQVYAQLDLEPVSAHGVTIECTDRSIIDFYGGHAVAALGYSHPAVVKAIRESSESLMFQSNAVALRVRAEAADKLADFAPAGLDRVFFVNSGAEANENALRLAFRHTGRTEVVALEQGFHGRSTAAGTVTWGAADKWYGFPRTPFDPVFVPRDDIDAACAAITENTAAVIMELVQGIGGAYALEPEFVAAVAARCKETGALLIADEVQTGIGRTGHAFACDAYDLKPDLLTVAKALGSGFPVGALLATENVAGSVGNGDLGTTFGGGPMACAVVSAVIDTVKNDNLLDNVQRLSQRIMDACPIGPVTSVQGMGFLLGLTCEPDAKTVAAKLRDHGILAGGSSDPKILRLLPPLTLGDEHVDQLLSALEAIGNEL